MPRLHFIHFRISEWGSRGRRFESSHPDHFPKPKGFGFSYEKWRQRLTRRRRCCTMVLVREVLPPLVLSYGKSSRVGPTTREPFLSNACRSKSSMRDLQQQSKRRAVPHLSYNHLPPYVSSGSASGPSSSIYIFSIHNALRQIQTKCDFTLFRHFRPICPVPLQFIPKRAIIISNRHSIKLGG